MSNEIEWKDYQMSIDSHKYYLDLSIKINLFYYAITGGVVSFYFSSKAGDISWVGLLLPIFMSLLFGGFFMYASTLAQNLRHNIKIRANKLGLEVFPNGIVLVLFCRIFGLLMILIGIVLISYISPILCRNL